MSRRPIEIARQAVGLEPVSLLESWNERNLEIAFWRLPGSRTLKFAATNHVACFAIKDVDEQALFGENGHHLRTGPIAAGRFRLVQGPALFETKLSNRTPIEMLNIYFSTRLMHQIAGELGQRARAVMLNDPQWDEQDDLLEKLAFSIVEDMQSPAAADRLFAQETAMLILHRLLVKYSNLTQPDHASGAVERQDYRKVVAFMLDNLDKPVSVDQLASLVDMTTFSFIRGFAKCYGATPMRHLRQLRLEKAKDMLIRTSLPIATVSQRLGFSDAAHFIGAFKKGSGMTPRAFRLAMTNMSGAM